MGTRKGVIDFEPRHERECMFSDFSYVLSHYAVFCVFLCAFWGAGQFVVRRIFKLEHDDTILGGALSLATGQGIFIVLLQGLAVGGQLRFTWLTVLLICGGLLAIWEWRSVSHHPQTNFKQRWSGLSKFERYGLMLVVLFALPTILAPLRTPLPGDELLYHLPHAKQWAQTGTLSVNEWLRYPWFPYNYNLLYASALIVYGDVFSHMFNTLAGWLVAVMTYRLGVRYLNQAVACVATIIWLHLNRGDFGKGIVDMGTTLYIFAASITFYWWLSSTKDRRWLAISAFLMGVAVGSKYQSLFFLPIFGVALLWKDRRPSTMLLALGSLLIPCSYWYVRNAVMTGDPFNPIGGKVFGFTDWNLQDYVVQFEDLKRQSAWPNMLLWPAALALWRLRRPKISIQIAATVLCGYYFLVWLGTSHYPRYLMPIFPWLALLAAEQWCGGFNFLGRRLGSMISIGKLRAVAYTLWFVIFTILALSSAAFTNTFWSYVAPTAAARIDLLRKEIPGYAILEYVNQNPVGRVYNFSSLSDAYYYFQQPIWGDVFGPWRYRDIASGDPVKFSSELLARNFDAVIVEDSYVKGMELNPSLGEHFSVVFKSNGFTLYRVEKIQP